MSSSPHESLRRKHIPERLQSLSVLRADEKGTDGCAIFSSHIRKYMYMYMCSIYIYIYVRVVFNCWQPLFGRLCGTNPSRSNPFSWSFTRKSRCQINGLPTGRADVPNEPVGRPETMRKHSDTVARASPGQTGPQGSRSFLMTLEVV